MNELNQENVLPIVRRAAKKKNRWLLPVVLVCIALLLASAAVFLWYSGYEKPYQLARNTMPQNGILSLMQQPDGTTLLQWPQGANVDFYRVRIFKGTEVPSEEENNESTGPAPELLFYAEFSDTLECVLPELPLGTELTIQIQSCTRYETLFSQEIRIGDADLTATGVFDPPMIQNLQWSIDPNTDQLSIQYDLSQGQVCQLLVSKNDGEETWLLELKEESTVLSFGETEKFPMPEYEETYDFYFGSYVDSPEYLYQGLSYKQFSMQREDMLGNELILECRDEGHNLYSLTWNETKGEHYEVQCYDESTDEWITVATIPNNGNRFYSTGHLARYSDFRYRVIALGGHTLAGGEYAATPAEVQMSTGPSLVYSTIWNLIDLEVYGDPHRGSVIGKAKKGSTFCILDEEDGLFCVRFGDSVGYLDSRYCMINLPEYLGDLCSYNIANSYASAFMVHGYEIPGITDNVVAGYEDVCLNEKTGEYLVPLLYPAAIKLEKAAFAALEKGYRLKIYDTYRPGEGSQGVRDAVEAILADPIPELPYVPKAVLKKDPNFVPEIPVLPVLSSGQPLTYKYLMTDNGRYAINYFIASYGSRHNLGIALDLTLEKADTGEELVMQTAIHDLSHYSELSKNVANSKLLSSIMRGAGFGGLVSEWWHFQDDDAQNSLALKHLWSGVSPKCWMADDNGWRYRKANGTYYKDCTATIDGVEYTFDADGYMV